MRTTGKLKSIMILDFIAGHKTGVPLIEIQRYAWYLNRGDEPFSRDMQRGYYYDMLLGLLANDARSRPKKLGLLNVFCEKNDLGLWVRTSMPHEDHPFRVLNREQREENRAYFLGR
jgi:hypothetical protein